MDRSSAFDFDSDDDSRFDASGSDESSAAAFLDDEAGTEDEDTGDDADNDMVEAGADDRAELRRLMGQEQKRVAAAVSEASHADALKGLAVRQQRKTFDRLLSARVSMQQALIAANSLPELATNSEDMSAADQAMQETDEALSRLINSMNALRSTFTSIENEKKRSQSDAFTLSEHWLQLEQDEQRQSKIRRTTLDKWSQRTNAARHLGNSSNRLNQNVAPQGVLTVLDDQLAGADKLIRRAYVPRSSAPLQAAKKVTETRDIFEDADFYGLLLKELLEQRGADVDAQTRSDAVASQLKAARAGRTRKVVDNKASKGRKMRFTVHEKLQNFMVPEERGSWGKRQADDLFSSLFGQRTTNGADTHSQDEEDGLGESEALKLFRN